MHETSEADCRSFIIFIGYTKIVRQDVEWYYAVSECLNSVYLDDTFKSKVKGRYYVYPNQPDFFRTYRRVQKELSRLENEIKPDVIYTILGPSYNFLSVEKLSVLFTHGSLHQILMRGVLLL